MEQEHSYPKRKDFMQISFDN